MIRPPRSAMHMALLALLGGGAPLLAQNITTFNLAGGMAAPTSDFGDRTDAGYTLIAGIGVRQRGSPLSGRLEGIYNELDPEFGRDKAKVGGITANAQYDFAPASGGSFTPYMIGGVGFFSTREPRFDDDNRTNVAWNLGGGLRIPLTGFSVYFEARYHRVADVNISLVPIVVGLQF